MDAPVPKAQETSNLHKPVTETPSLLSTFCFLVLILILSLSLLFPAIGWNWVSAKQFSLEILQDTISILFLRFAPPLAISSLLLAWWQPRTSQHILACAGIVNFSIPLLHYIYDYGFTADCLQKILQDTFSLTLSSLWVSELIRISIVFIFLVIFESSRCNLSILKVIVFISLPSEIAIPLFLDILKESELRISRKTSTNAFLVYCALAITSILTWWVILYRWASEEGSGRFQNMITGLIVNWHGVRIFGALLIILLSLSIHTLPTISVSASKFPKLVVQCMIQMIFTWWLVSNMGASFACYLALRERTQDCSFGKANIQWDQDILSWKHLNSYWFLFIVSSFISFTAPFHKLFFTMALMIGFTLISHFAIPDFDFGNVVMKIVWANKFIGFIYLVVTKMVAVVIWDLSKPFAWYLMTKEESIFLLLSLLTGLIGLLFYAAFQVYRTNLWSKRTLFRILPFLIVSLIGYQIINRLTTKPVCTLELNREYLDLDRLPSIGCKVRSIVESSDIPASRLHHHQGHGCVVAEFQVENSIAPQLRHGIFNQPAKKFPALIRFSSSSRRSEDDTNYDSLGFAMKLFDVDGERLLSELESTTQDFILSSNPTFFVHEMDGNDILDILHRTDVYSFLQWTIPRPWHFMSIFKLFASWIRGQSIQSPLQSMYYSNTPYRLGPELAVKWAVRPCFDSKAMNHSYQNGYYLREAMIDALSKHDACFEFLVQKQRSACEEPIEDPTTAWKTPFIQVATIHIPAQNFLGFQQHRVYCQNIGFNPWNGIKSHKPLGKINHQRKEAYIAGYHTRSHINKINSTLFQNFLQLAEEPKWEGGNTKHYKYKNYASPFQHLPKRIAQLEPSLDFDKNTLLDFYLYLGATVVGASLEDLRCSLDTRCFNTFEDFKPLTSFDIGNRWKEDEEFARHFITGINPMQITAVEAKGLPIAFNRSVQAIEVMNNHLKRRSEPSFEILEQTGRLFYADYEILDGIHAKDDNVFYPSIVILYWSNQQKLLPLAIQLTRNAENPIYSPDDSEPVWLFARMHAALSDALVHEMVHHLCYTHLVVEPIIIAFNRQLPEHHPLLKLMKPHFHHTLAINSFGRSSLLKPEDGFDIIAATGLNGSLQLMQKVYQQFHFQERSFPEELKSRGFYEVKNNRDNLPGYYFRDDGFKIWTAMNHFVSDVIQRQYLVNIELKDEFIKNDPVLQSLYYELTHDGLAGIKGIQPFDSVKSLENFLTSLLWICTAQHSAVNFGQEEYYSFIPSRPFLLTKLMPSDKSRVNWEFIYSALPDAEKTLKSIQIAKFLSLPTEKPLIALQKDHPFPKEYESFQNELLDITMEIEERNQLLEQHGKIPYIWLIPNNIASSIAI